MAPAGGIVLGRSTIRNYFRTSGRRGARGTGTTECRRQHKSGIDGWAEAGVGDVLLQTLRASQERCPVAGTRPAPVACSEADGVARNTVFRGRLREDVPHARAGRRARSADSASMRRWPAAWPYQGQAESHRQPPDPRGGNAHAPHFRVVRGGRALGRPSARVRGGRPHALRVPRRKPRRPRRPRGIPTVSNLAGAYVEEGTPRPHVQTIYVARAALARQGLCQDRHASNEPWPWRFRIRLAAS